MMAIPITKRIRIEERLNTSKIPRIICALIST
jgi:hypothetical protein